MTTSQDSKGIERFLQEAPSDISGAAAMLSAAVALTDDLACALLQPIGSGHILAKDFVMVLRSCDFVVVRNGEWYLNGATRSVLLSHLEMDREAARKVHRQILKIVNNHNGIKLPAYLKSPHGKAYHQTAIDPEEGMQLYQKAFPKCTRGQDWLLAKLATEQQNSGWISQADLEPTYFQGVVAYRDGRRREAWGFLIRIADNQQKRIEVAIALHILGQIAWHDRHDKLKAQNLFIRSLTLGKEIGNQLHQAHVLHSLGNLWSRKDAVKAEGYYQESLIIGKETGNQYHQAQVLHSLGNLWSRKDVVKAEGYYQQSLTIGKETGNQYHQAQVLHSLGNLWSREIFDLAKGYYYKSLAIEKEIGRLHGEAQVLHSLGNLWSRKDFDKSEGYYQQSLIIGKEIGNQYHQAQVLNSLGKLWSQRDRSKAEIYYQQSLSVGEEIGNRDHQGHVLNSWGFLYLKEDSEKAKEKFQEAVRRTNDPKTNAIAFNGLSLVAENNGFLKEAIEDLKLAIKWQKRAGGPEHIRKHEERLVKLKKEYEGLN